MNEKEPGEDLQEEPQEARGDVGSRDEGSDEPAGGPVDRPAGTATAEDSTKVGVQEPIDEDMPTFQAGDQGG